MITRHGANFLCVQIQTENTTRVQNISEKYTFASNTKNSTLKYFLCGMCILVKKQISLIFFNWYNQKLLGKGFLYHVE